MTAKPVTAICPECKGEVEVDPLAATWPLHAWGGGTPPRMTSPVDCAQSGKLMPNEMGEALQVEGVPHVRVPQSVPLELHRVQMDYNENERAFHVTFPDLDGAECIVKDGPETPEDGAVLLVSMGKGFLAPKVSMVFQFPKIPAFSSPEQADEWMEQMANG